MTNVRRYMLCPLVGFGNFVMRDLKKKGFYFVPSCGSPCLNRPSLPARPGDCVQPSSGNQVRRTSPPIPPGSLLGWLRFSAASHSFKPSQCHHPWGNSVLSLMKKTLQPRGAPRTRQRSDFAWPPSSPCSSRLLPGNPRSQSERRGAPGCRVPSPGPAPLCCGGQWTRSEHRRLPG